MRMSMMVKYATKIDMEDEFLRISPDMSIETIIKEILPQKPHRESGGMGENIITPILAAYVMEGDKPVGIIDRDTLLEAIAVQNRDLKETRAKDIMKPPVLFNENTPVQDLLNTIIDNGLLTVAIVEDEKLIGIISVFDAFFLQKEIDSANK